MSKRRNECETEADCINEFLFFFHAKLQMFYNQKGYNCNFFHHFSNKFLCRCRLKIESIRQLRTNSNERTVHLKINAAYFNNFLIKKIDFLIRKT